MSLEYMISLTDGVTGPAKSATGGLDALTKGLGGAEGGMSALDAICPGLGEALGVLGPIAIGVAAAFAALVIGGSALALQATAFKEHTTVALKALTGSQEAAEATYAQIGGLANKFGMSLQDTGELAQKLIGSGIQQGAQLEAAITATANLSAAFGDKGAAKLTQIIQKSGAAGKFVLSAKTLTGTGVSIVDVYGAIGAKIGKSNKEVEAMIKAGKISASDGIDALNATINSKLAGVGASKALELDAQFTVLKNNVMGMFDGVDTKPFLGALHDMLSVFDASSPSAQALKFLVTGAFSAIFAIASKVFPLIKTFFLQLVIGALKIYIAMKPVIAHFKELFGSAAGGDALTSVVKLVADAIVYCAEQVVILVAGVAYFYEVMIGVWTGVATGVGVVIDAFRSVYDATVQVLSGGAEIAGNFIDGLIGGITGGVSRVVDAAKNLGASAMGAVKGVLGIASPSKEMALLGGHTASGFADGVDAGAPAAQSAMASLAAPPALGASSPSSSAASSNVGGGSGGGVSVTIAAGAIVIQGVKDAAEGADAMISQLAQAFEQMGLQGGG